MDYAASAAANLRAALEREGLAGVEWEAIALDTDRLPDLRHRASGAARLRFLVPYDEPHRLRTLIAHLLESGVWVDVSRLVIRPVGHARTFACVLDLAFSDPRIAFQSPLVRRSLAGSKDLAAQYQAVADALVGEFETVTSTLPEERRQPFRAQLETYLRGGHEAEAAAFEDELDERLRPVMVDLRLYVDLPRSHRHVFDAVDRWIEFERVLPRDGVRGKTFFREPWPAFVPSLGVHENPEVRPGAPPRSSDPEALFRMVADGNASRPEREDALFHLHVIDSDAARACSIRAVGFDEVRLNALSHAVAMPAMAPFFREAVFATDTGRVAAALDRLRDFDVAFSDPLAAWSSAGAGDVRRGEIYQAAILADYPRCGDREIVPRLIEELRSGSRLSDWVCAAVGTLKEFRAAEAAEAVRRWIGNGDAFVRRAALEFFAVADHPPALPLLLDALGDIEIDTTAAAEQGLSGQTSAGWTLLLDALDRLHHRAIAIPARSPDDIHRNQLGTALVRSLVSRPGKCPDLEVVRRTVRRIGATVVPGIAHLLGVVSGEETPGRLLRETAVAASTPEATFTERMRIWTVKGYAAERYRSDGHRDPAWDDWVERGHAMYDPDRSVQGEDVQRAYEEAVRRGCRDGMVHYRLAVCRHTRGDLARAREAYRSALALLPERYPQSAYGLCAEAALGQLDRNEGKPEDALTHFRRAVREDMAVRAVRDQIPDLEEELRALKTDPAGAKSIDTGRLLPVPGLRHPARVTALEISADGRALLTADEAGHVQVSRVAEDASPALEPRVRGKAHAEGLTVAAWIAPLDRVFVSAGTDGLVRRVRFQPGRPLEWTTLAERARPIVAVARLSDREVVCADADGAVFTVGTEGGEVRELTPTLRGRVAALLVEGGRLVSVRERNGFEVWKLPVEGPPEWSHPMDREMAFADACGSGLLCVGVGENVKTFRLDTGEAGRPIAMPPGNPAARFGRFDIRSGVAVWGWAAGGIRVDAAQGGFQAVTEPLAAVDVSFEHRLVAAADTHGVLRLYVYEA